MFFRIFFGMQTAIFLLMLLMYISMMGSDKEVITLILFLVIGAMTLVSGIMWRRQYHVARRERLGQSSNK